MTLWTRSRRFRATWVLCWLIVGGGAVAVADQPGPARGLDIYFIDAQGGAATLLVTPERETVLIDAGYATKDDRDAKRIERVLKDVAGLERIDHLVTTHWHQDHYGGVAGLARRVQIGHFWDRGLPEDNEPGVEFPLGPKADDPMGAAYRAASAGKRTILRAGDALPLRGGISAVVLAASKTILAPPDDAPANPLCDQPPEHFPVAPGENDWSLALKFRAGMFDFLACGDLTWDFERKLVCPRDLIGRIDLFMVTHHGRNTSNNPILLRTIEPIVTVMNNGPNKAGDVETVRALRTIPSIQAAYQLHRNQKTGDEGNTDPSLIVNNDPAGGRFLHVAVSPDGATFRVKMDVDGPERVFESR